MSRHAAPPPRSQLSLPDSTRSVAIVRHRSPCIISAGAYSYERSELLALCLLCGIERARHLLHK
jgi:hypothetical protein